MKETMLRITAAVAALALSASLVACGDASSDSATSSTAKTVSSASKATASTASETPAASAEPSANLTIKLSTENKEYDLLTADLRTYVDKGLAQTTIDYSDMSNYKIECNASYVPLRWTFEGDAVQSVTVELSTQADFSNPIAYTAEGNTLDCYNLCTGQHYYWRVKAVTANGTVTSAASEFTTKSGPRTLKIDGVYNTRDLGGWKTLDGRTIKQGVVFRTGKIGVAKETGFAALARFGIKTELDLRKDTERSDMTDKSVSPLGKSVTYILNSSSQYAAFLGAEDSVTSLRLFADPANYPILFHCAGGADRTGTLAAFMEALCNCSEATLVTDYELTSGKFRKGDFSGFMEKFKAIDGATLADKAKTYCYTRGMTRMEVSNIINMLTTDSAVFTGDSLKAAANGTFTLDLRQSGGVKSVTVDGKSANFTLSGNKLTVKASSGNGTITLKDGATLDFAL